MKTYICVGIKQITTLNILCEVEVIPAENPFLIVVLFYNSRKYGLIIPVLET